MTDNERFIQDGTKGKYYVIDGIKYTEQFPIKWALNHKQNPFPSGPKTCENCKEYGSINGVFVNYCTMCVLHVYNGIDNPRRNCVVNPATESEEYEKNLWEGAPYMENIKLSEIGGILDEPISIHEEADLPESDSDRRAKFWRNRERYWDNYDYESNNWK